MNDAHKFLSQIMNSNEKNNISENFDDYYELNFIYNIAEQAIQLNEQRGNLRSF